MKRRNQLRSASKKQRTSAVEFEELTSPLAQDLLTDVNKARLKKEFDSSIPYRNVVIEPLCLDERMRAVCEEVKRLQATYKETDLFKLFQTTDLANFDSKDIKNAPHMQQLISLREALYSTEFRAFISDITGCGELIERTDMAANAYVKGCHLLCHDDVIGNRKISYIIYLPDPDDPWEEKDGGYLELYPLDMTEGNYRSFEGSVQGIPTVTPTTLIAPKYNTMAIFTVEPGRSYHAVQEVFAEDKPRLSIQGWYHAATPPSGSDMASLKQIMHKGDENKEFELLPPLKEYGEKEEGGESKEDFDAEMKALSEWLNPTYLQMDSIEGINQRFCDESSLQLHDFLRKDVAEAIQKATQAVDALNSVGSGRPPSSYDIGMEGGWSAQGPPHKRRFLTFNSDSNAAAGDSPYSVAGQLLHRVREKLFQSVHFASYLRRLTTLRPTAIRGGVRRFRPGLDYTVAYYGGMTDVPKLDATLCFVDTKVSLDVSTEKPEEEEDEAENGIEEGPMNPWDDGDVGGFECYLAADISNEDETDAAEVYRAETTDEDEVLSVSAGSNVLSLVMRDEGVMRFIKYVGAGAPGSRWDIAVEYEIEEPERDEEDQEDQEEDKDEEES